MISNCKFSLLLEPQQNIPKTAKKTAKSLTPLVRFAYHQMNRPRELIFDVTKRFYGIFKRIEITAFAARSQLQINHEKESRKCWEANVDVWKLIWLRPFCGGESVIFQRGDGWGGRKKKEEKSARDLGDEKKARRASNDASAMIETTKKQPKKVKCEWLLTNNKWIQQQLHPQQSFPAAHQLQHPLTLLVFTRKCVVLNCGVEFRYARRLDSRLFAVKGAERRGGTGGRCRIANIFGLFENLLCKPDDGGSFYILNIRFVTDPIMLAQLPSPRFSDFEILRFAEPQREKFRRCCPTSVLN